MHDVIAQQVMFAAFCDELEKVSGVRVDAADTEKRAFIGRMMKGLMGGGAKAAPAAKAPLVGFDASLPQFRAAQRAKAGAGTWEGAMKAKGQGVTLPQKAQAGDTSRFVTVDEAKRSGFSGAQATAIGSGKRYRPS